MSSNQHQGFQAGFSLESPMTFGGCPSCGRKNCVARECRGQNRSPALQEAAPAQQTCTWKFDDSESGTWASSCGELWSFIEGGPRENRVRYCHYCGGKVLIQDESEDQPNPEGTVS